MILRAAHAVQPGRAIVLGAGACEEIPLAELVGRFAEVVVNDVDEQPLRRTVDTLVSGGTERARIDVQIADLSGLTHQALEHIERAIAGAADAPSAIHAMACGLDDVQPSAFPIAGRFDLVVASCVLSQLHFALVHEAAALCEARFPGSADLLQGSDVWKNAVFRTARRMEEKFILDLANLLDQRGQVYLSESAQMCYLQLTRDGRWQTAGTYRMLRTADLSDYVQANFTIVHRGRWEWIVMPPAQVGDTGRMYDVQALVLETGDA
jgi:hypothetical protein